MSETPSVAPSSAISYRHDKPVWDVTQVTAYPFTFKQGKRSAVVQVYLSPYTADELKAVLRKAVSGYRREGRDVEIVREDREIYAKLCDDHFVRFGNAKFGDSESSVDAERAYLDKYPQTKPSIIEHSFGGLSVDNPTEGDGDDKLDISMELSGAVDTYQELYDPINEGIVKVSIVHNHKHPTEAQFREFRGSRRSKFLRKSTLWTISEAHGTLEKLYDAVITSVTGICVNGVPCLESNKSDWLAHVPLWHKLLVVDQIFGELVEKNV